MRRLIVITLLAVCASVYATGGISGVVTDSVSGLPIHYARVSTRADSSIAYTDTAGHYLISPLQPGEYTVTVTASGHVGDTYPEPVVVVDSQITTGIDFALVPLPPTGISGLVTVYGTGNPIYHATLSGGGLPTKYSDSSGAYFIPASPGWYVLWCSQTGYENGIYPESIHVQPGVVTESINFALISITGKTGIGGRLTDGSRELGIGGGTVIASGPGGCDTATSVATGGYLISGLALGKYQVTATAEGFQTGIAPDSVLVESGMVKWCPFYLLPESTPPTGISGHITNYENGDPIYHATVSGNGLPTKYTDSSGAYFIPASPGQYTLWAWHDGYENGIYPESIHVEQDVVTDSIDFALISTAGKTGIGGRLTDASRMLGISGGTIIASGQYGCDTATSVPTGGYVISGLATGKYEVTAYAEGFQTKVAPDSVLVESGQVKWCPFYLQPESTGFGGMAGLVTNGRGGLPLFGALVTAPGPGQGVANTGTQGSYTIRNLEPGTYLVKAGAAGFETSAWDTVEVTAGHTVPNVNFVLQPSSYGTGGIAGNVSDSTGQNHIPNARVFAWGSEGQGYAYSDAGGSDVVTGLADGWYRVRAEAQGYYPACYPGNVEVAGGHITSGIDFRLRPVGSSVAGIAGFAYDGYQQVELPGAHVRVTGGQNFWEVYAGSSGDYVLDGLPPGEYIVQADVSGYEPGQYPDLVTVANGTVASFISPALYPPTPVAEPHAPAGIPTSYLFATPNPARGAVRVQWQIKEPGTVTLRVFDNTGRAVRTIQNGFQAAGRYSASWNGICDNGMRAANGVLFYTLDAPGIHRVVKVAVVSR
jgi:hypothetical protein